MSRVSDRASKSFKQACSPKWATAAALYALAASFCVRNLPSRMWFPSTHISAHQRPLCKETPLKSDVPPRSARVFRRLCVGVTMRRLQRRLSSVSWLMWSTYMPAGASMMKRCMNTVRNFLSRHRPIGSWRYAYPLGMYVHFHRESQSKSASSTVATLPALSWICWAIENASWYLSVALLSRERVRLPEGTANCSRYEVNRQAAFPRQVQYSTLRTD